MSAAGGEIEHRSFDGCGAQNATKKRDVPTFMLADLPKQALILGRNEAFGTIGRPAASISWRTFGPLWLERLMAMSPLRSFGSWHLLDIGPDCRDQEHVAGSASGSRSTACLSSRSPRARSQAARRTQRRDERALPQGPRLEDEARARGPVRQGARPAAFRTVIGSYEPLAQPGPTTGEREVDENKAEVVLSIFAAFVSGERPRAIAKDLNEQGVSGERGVPWSSATDEPRSILVAPKSLRQIHLTCKSTPRIIKLNGFS